MSDTPHATTPEAITPAGFARMRRRSGRRSLYEHPSIVNIAVVGVPDGVWGEQVGAVVQVTRGSKLDVATLRDFCRKTLAPHKVPRLWYATNDYSLVGSRKIQKFVLVERITCCALQPTLG